MSQRAVARLLVASRAPKPVAGPRRSGKATAARMIAAAMACGLTKAQALDLLHETIAVGVAIATRPGANDRLRGDLERRTKALVVGLRATRHLAAA